MRSLKAFKHACRPALWTAAFLFSLNLFAQDTAKPDKDRIAIAVETLSRLKGIDLEANPAVKTAVLKVIEQTKGTPQFVELIRDFKIKGRENELLEYALSHPAESAGVDAFKLVAENEPGLAKKSFQSTNAIPAIKLAGNSGDKQLHAFLEDLVASSKDSAVKKEAVRALAKSQDGANFILKLAREGKLPVDVKLIASSELNLAPWPSIKKEALELLPLPKSQNAESLPPISELLKRKGNPGHGREVFFSPASACSSCHQINGQGQNIGPALSEIGTKLGKDALYESILDPSSGISFGYEAWNIELKNGDELFGLITSETADEISVKNQGGIVTKIKKSEIASRQKLSTSMMPEGLQLTMSTQDLVDLVEFLSTLKKAPESK